MLTTTNGSTSLLAARPEDAMAVLDEEPAKKKLAHEVGEDLSRLSLDELAARVALLKAEIERIEAAAAVKRASATAAQSFFKR